MAHDPYAALRIRDYRLLTAGNISAVIGGQMVGVALSWEIYQRTNSATALGLVGLFQVIPLVLLSLHAGRVVDRRSRKSVIMVSQGVLVLSGLSLAVASYFHDRIPAVLPLRTVNELLAKLAWGLGERHARFEDAYVPLMYVLIFVNGVVRSFNQPAKSAFLPQIVPAPIFSNAVAWNSSVFEVCSMVGPTVAGGLLAAFHGRDPNSPWAYPVVYGLNGIFQLGQILLLLPVKANNPPRKAQETSLASLSAGLRFVWYEKVILAALTIDLFAVILGGATALLPIFAKDILHVGPGGLGWLRAAPSIGAFATGILVAHLPPMKHTGRNLLVGVAGFGVATVVFGLSKTFWLSFSMLLLTGVFDNVSVVIRHTLVQLRTPDEIRGRVSAVNGIFFGASNQIGTLESGVTAALFGAVASVVIGGVGTMLVVVAAALIWPQLRRLGSLEAPANSANDPKG